MENKLLLQDLADAIATKEGITKKKSESFVKALFETIEEGLLTDKFVKIKGLGTFKIITVGERESVNINTGERFSIEGHERITFTPDTQLKDLVNRPFAHFQTVVINEETDIEELESVEDEINASKTPDIDSSEKTEVNNEEIKEKIQVSPLEMAEPPTLQNEENLAPISDEETPTSAEAENAKPSLDLVTTENAPIPNKVEEHSQEKEEKESDNKSDTEEEGKISQKVLINNNSIDQEQTEQKEVIDSSKKTAQEKETEFSENEPIDIVTENNSETKSEDNSTTSINTDTSYTKEEKETSNHSGNTEYHNHHRNREEEHIRYIIKEVDNKRNFWKTTALVLLAILLLVLSYFAGYFRWFCPCEFTNRFINTNPVFIDTKDDTENLIPATILDTSTIKKNETATPKDTIARNHEIRVKDDNTTAPVETVEKKDTHPNVIQKEKEVQPTSSKVQKVKKNTPPPANPFKQVAGGKYKITGTLKTHTIENGETIRTIALDVYGSKGYAIYIITHNNLTNPDNVDTGTIIKLPKLERRNR